MTTDPSEPLAETPLSPPDNSPGAEAPTLEEVSAASAPVADAPVADAPVADAPIADGIAKALDPRSVTLGRVVGGITAAALATALLLPTLIVTFAASLGLGGALGLLAAWTALSGLLTWRLLTWPAKSHRHASYRVDALGIEIRRGVWWRRVIHVPRSRVQHTDVDQGPLERSYGLGTLSIFTAGTDHAQVQLSGLAHETALAIRDHLLPREGGDAV